MSHKLVAEFSADWNKKKKMCERLHLHLWPPDGIFRIGSARRAVGGANLEVTYGFAVAEEEDTAK